MREIIFKHALQNAVFYKGKANPKAVLGKILSENPDLRKDIAHVREQINDVIEEVNSMTLEEQQDELEDIDPSLLEKEEKKQEELGALDNAEMGKVVTRFAPAPSGPLHLPHLLRAAYLSYLYAKKYDGKFILRLEDTDPKLVQKEFYSWIQEDLKIAGIEWDELYIESDDMEEYYKKVNELISFFKAYVCVCTQEEFMELKKKKEDCPCREFTDRKNSDLFEKMKSGMFKEGQAVVRFKTSMQDPNPAVRDPPIMRLSFSEHPIRGDKYCVWPLYNFANVIEDHSQGITHVFRGKEHEHNSDIQSRIYKAFKWDVPTFVGFGMIYFPGDKLHKRDIKQGIIDGKYTGWDDIKLPNVRSLIRRGYQPEAFRLCAVSAGLSKTDVKFGLENLEAINRKLIDQSANRYMVVLDPVKINISAGLRRVDIKDKIKNKHHPDKKTKKTVPVSSEVFISKEDSKEYKNKTLRLIDLFNIKMGKKIEYSKKQDFDFSTPKIQWVADKHISVHIITPEGTLEGFGEQEMGELKVGDIIQMVRIGFGRVDSVSKNEITIWFAHK